MEKNKQKSKKVVWIVFALFISILAVAIYELTKFKPLPPTRHPDGQINSESLNGFNNIPRNTEIY